MIDTTYEFYRTSYGGCLIPEKDWKRSVRKAESYLGSILHQVPAENQVELVQLALCESAELVWQDEQQRSEHGGRRVKSENTDGYSVTYAADGGASDGDGEFPRSANLRLSEALSGAHRAIVCGGGHV